MTNLTLDSILEAVEAFKKRPISFEPSWNGVIIESALLTDPSAVKENVYARLRKNKRWVWWRVAIRTRYIRVPSRSVYILPNGCLVAHPQMVAEIRKALSGPIKGLDDLKDMVALPTLRTGAPPVFYNGRTF